MRLRTHAVLAFLQFLVAFIGVLGFLALGGILGYVEPLWRGGKALFAPLFALEGLCLAAIPSYVIAAKFLKLEWGRNSVFRILCVGLVQGILFPLIAFGTIKIGLLGWPNDELGTDIFWLFMAVLLALAAIVSSMASALLVRALPATLRKPA